MNSKNYVKSRECNGSISECLLHANFTSRNRVHPETFRTERAISNAPLAAHRQTGGRTVNRRSEISLELAVIKGVLNTPE